MTVHLLLEKQSRPSHIALPTVVGARSCFMAPATLRLYQGQVEACLGTVGEAPRPEHVGSMAASSADDHLTVDGDANEKCCVVGA